MKKIFFSSLLVILTLVGIVPRLAAQTTPQITPKTVPYFEGFEEGNTDQENVVGWLQQEEDGVWVANSTQTSSNRIPYAGKWNATLCSSNINWLFQYITLEQGKTYRFSMYARQTYSSNSYIIVQLGSSPHEDSMQTTIVPQTSVIWGKYQLLTGKFSVETTGNYVIGIKGKITASSSYLSIDNICINEDIMHTISTTNAELGKISVSNNSAVFGDTIILSHTMTKGIFAGYATNTPVHWISDTSFVVLHDDVVVGFDTSSYHALPFFEGFENGNIDQQPVADWEQQFQNVRYAWVANSTKTDYNRTPLAGSWNATFLSDNTDWFYAVVPLKADTPYDISLYARQDFSDISYANITVALGKAIDKDSMTITIIPETSFKNGDYQWLRGTFSVPADGYYVFGIKGYITDGSSYYSNYISLDNILLQEHTAHTITIPVQECGTLTATPSSAFMGDTVTLNYTMNTGYFFRDYTTDVPVQWVDANRFIMPAEDVTIALDAVAPKAIPYFEGFENGNTDQKKVAGWVPQSESGNDAWVANDSTKQTNHNRAPFAGRWNATLRCNNTDWLFQSLALEAGENYVLSLYARQDQQYTSYANITAKLGTACSKDAMTTTIIPATGLNKGDYQLLTGTFHVAETKAYVLGIKGYLNTTPYYISMDNILVSQEVYPASVDTLYFDVLTEDAARTALDTLTLTAVDTKGNTKHTFENVAANWVIDLENKKATYTVANSLLPMGYFFAEPTATITVDLAINQYTLTVGEAENGSVKVAVDGKDTTVTTFAYGTEVTLTAIPNEGYYFVEWSDGSRTTPYVFTLKQNCELTAHFAQGLCPLYQIFPCD